MVSFKELHEADFAGVTETAEAWTSMATALDALDSRVSRDLTGTPQRAGWEGPAAVRAGAALKGVDTDVTQAAAVAKALAAIIRDAAAEFTAARRALDTAIHDAESQTMTVSADGEVRWPPMPGARNDPDAGPAVKKYDEEMKVKAEAISARLTKAVQQATAADRSAAVALQSDVGSSTTAFNAKPYGGGDTADARRANDLLTKGGSLSDSELQQLQSLLAANSGSKEFSTTLLNSLNAGGHGGPEALLDYAKVYGDLGRGNHNAQQYQDVHAGLGQVLATATKDGGMGRSWEDDLLKAARKPGGSAAGYNDNYRALTELMGAGGDFDKPFLTKVGNDLVDYERTSALKGEELWGPDYSAVTGRQGDPMRGLMKAMSHNPEASKEFLDPGANKNLDYLLKDRQWPNQGYEHQQTDSLARDTSRGAFGDALQAATTGRDPHGNQPPVRPHDEAMARIMSETVNHFGGDRAGHENELPAALRRPLGEMIADYAPDTYEILGKETGGTSETSGLTIRQDQMLRVIRGVAEDPEAFQPITRAETEEIARRLEGYPDEAFQPDGTGRPNHRIEGFAHEAAEVMGALSGVRTDVIDDHRDDQNFRANWTSKMQYHVIGAPLTPIPVVGDVAQRLVDIGTAAHANEIITKNDREAAAQISDAFRAGDEQLKAMIRGRAQAAGIPLHEVDATGGVTTALLNEVDKSYQTGVDNAHRQALGRD
ncbi:DUF6571 family protein [Kitasatospora sp. NPDC057500]|uniref:DUF6571 family protein n=1 Tax=Kitasatospora sp. NPDC057500 TaxID=3346151 RepID=UPI00368B609A